MFQDSEIFEKHYQDYCAQIDTIDFESIKERLGTETDGGRMRISLFDKAYLVSGDGIFDASGNRPDYGACVIMAKYILLCPDRSHYDPEWVSFKDFKKVSHFTNVNFFTSDTEQAIAKHFSGRLERLTRASKKLGSIPCDVEMSYDLAVHFHALPRISLLLLFNDGDEEFPAQCTVLFQKHAEHYLDPESLAMSGSYLAGRLKRYGRDFES